MHGVAGRQQLALAAHLVFEADARDGAVARITLDRPDAANGLSMEMAKELLEVSIACRSGRDARRVPAAAAAVTA